MQKLLRVPHLLHYQYKSSRALTGLAKSDGQFPNGRWGVEVPPSVRSRRPGDEMQTLCQQGQLTRGLGVLLQMDEQGTVPSLEMYRSLLKACAKRKALAQAKRVLAHLTRHGLESTSSFGEFVVSTLVKCGGLEDAVQVFQRLPQQSVFAWTAIISGYAVSGQGIQALKLYQWMQEKGVQPNAYTLVSLLKACGSLSDLQEGKRIHAEAVKHRCQDDLFVGTCLVDMYGKCGSIVDAQNVFNTLAKRDVVSWTAMLAAYRQQSQPDKALLLYDQMKEEGVSPNDRSLVNALQACSILAETEEDAMVDGRAIKPMALERGKFLHADIWKKGYISDLFLGSSLISM